MKFSIIVTSDVHGHAENFSQLAQQIEARSPSLLIDNGDFLQGSHLSYYYERIARSTHPMIEMANKLAYDVAIFGNHEFNYSLQDIAVMRDACQFPWIAANITDFAAPYFMKEIENIRVAVIGVVTHHTPYWDEWHSTDNLQFTDAFESARYWVKKVREIEKPDLVILSYHGGFERDPKTGASYDADCGENQGYKMLNEIDGIDILITGHQHLEIASVVDGVSVVQPGANGNCLAEIEVTIKDGIIHHEPQLIYVDTALKATPFKHFKQWMNEPIASCTQDLTYRQFAEPRTAWHPYVELVHQMQLDATVAQLSITELPYHTSGGFSGVITRRDVLHNYPRANFLKVIELTGDEIRTALEQCAAVFALTLQDEIDFSAIVHYPDPHPYVYDIWGGLDYELTISNALGERVTKLLYEGIPITDAMNFEVAINSYRANGMHNFDMLKKQAIREIRIDTPALFMRYLQRQGEVNMTEKSNWAVRK